ncbi:MAG: CHASE2 domain-containing protein [Planctomycetes bacterium]|nr:CHASE2 domain-containing protein [Planctomycetota bacterium]
MRHPPGSTESGIHLSLASRFGTRSRRLLPQGAGFALSLALLFFLLAGPPASWLLARERASTIAFAGRRASSREVVVVDLERWPREASELDQAIRSLARAGPSVLVLDILMDDSSSMARGIEEAREDRTSDVPGALSALSRAGCPTLLAATFDWEETDGSSDCPGAPLFPIQALSEHAIGIADFGPPRPPDESDPLMAVRQVWRGPNGESWMGMALAAAALHRRVSIPPSGLPGGISAREVDLGGRERVPLDDGLLWLGGVPAPEDFDTVSLSSLLSPDDEILDRLRGRIVLVGLVGSASGLDWHLTPRGYRRGALVHAALIEQILDGRGLRPLPETAALALTLLAFLISASVTFFTARARAGAFPAVALATGACAAAWIGFAGDWVFLPSIRPALGALLGCAGVTAGRLWVLRADLEAFRRQTPDSRSSESPVARLLRRVYFLRSIANEMVKARPATVSADPAFAAQDADQLVFQHSDRVLARIAAMEWEEGTARGVQHVVEILYQSLYEASGDLKRIPESFKREDSPIFLIKTLRNYFDHSYEMRTSLRHRLEQALLEIAGANLADIEIGKRELCFSLQTRLIEEAIAWLEALQDHLRREVRTLHILAPRGYWLARIPRFVWLWEGEAPGWSIEVHSRAGNRVLSQRLSGDARSFSRAEPAPWNPGEYSVEIFFEPRAKGADAAGRARFVIPAPAAFLKECLPLLHESSGSGETERVEEFARRLEEIHDPLERGRLLMDSGIFRSEAAIDLLDVARRRPGPETWAELVRALAALHVPEDLARSALLAPESPRGGVETKDGASHAGNS